MRRTFAVRAAALVTAAAFFAGAAAPPQAGSAILEGAEREAARTHRAIFAMFEASW